MQFSSIQPIDRALSGEPTSKGNEGMLYIPQSHHITGTLTSDCLVSYLGHLLFYPSTEKLAVYSTAPFDWAIK